MGADSVLWRLIDDEKKCHDTSGTRGHLCRLCNHLVDSEAKYIENKDFTSPVVIWVPQGQKQANILDRAWNLVTVDLE